ncbi:MAG TPA: hypothetical protein IAB58_02285 [Candidatus Pelethosoma merdigallinarum]|nr:hypothetical protein [Candidatus Pelethosoma merdigallinarum]
MLESSCFILSELIEYEKDKDKVMKMSIVLGNLRILRDRLSTMLRDIDDLIQDPIVDYDYIFSKDDFDDELE